MLKRLARLVLVFGVVLFFVPKPTVLAAYNLELKSWDFLAPGDTSVKQQINSRYYVNFEAHFGVFSADVINTNGGFLGPVFESHCYVIINDEQHEIPVKNVTYRGAGNRMYVECDKGSVGNWHEGENKVDFKVKLLLGNPPRQLVETSASQKVYIDTIAPSGSISLVVPGDCQEGKLDECEVKVSLNVTDQAPGRVQKVECKYRGDGADYRVKNVSSVGLPATTYSTSFKITLDQFGITKAGDHTLEVKCTATDEKGNSKEFQNSANIKIKAAPTPTPSPTLTPTVTPTAELTETPTQTPSGLEPSSMLTTPPAGHGGSTSAGRSGKTGIVIAALAAGSAAAGLAYLGYSKWFLKGKGQESSISENPIGPSEGESGI